METQFVCLGSRSMAFCRRLGSLTSAYGSSFSTTPLRHLPTLTSASLRFEIRILHRFPKEARVGTQRMVKNTNAAFTQPHCYSVITKMLGIYCWNVPHAYQRKLQETEQTLTFHCRTLLFLSLRSASNISIRPSNIARMQQTTPRETAAVATTAAFTLVDHPTPSLGRGASRAACQTVMYALGTARVTNPTIRKFPRVSALTYVNARDHRILHRTASLC